MLTAPPLTLTPARDEPDGGLDGDRATARRERVLDRLADAIDESRGLDVPPPVTVIARRGGGHLPKLSVQALELARVTYYEGHGSLRDCAHVIVDAGAADTDSVDVVHGRLRTWWKRERWPRRSHRASSAIRDANHDGGLYRGERLCRDVTTGNGATAAGQPCTQTALADSDYCATHDPRPEYVEARRVAAQRLTAGRNALLVPIAPFRAWCEAKREQVLAEARAAGPVHPNQNGVGLLAARVGVDGSVLARWMAGRRPEGDRVERIKALSVERALEAFGERFRDLYGYDPPRPAQRAACPGCGGPMSTQSRSCRDCSTRAGEQCTYVNAVNERCVIWTQHPSGFCSRCRRVAEHVPRPRRGRPSRLTTERLILALGEFRDVPVHVWVAKRMLQANAGDIRGAYKDAKSLSGALAVQFAKRGWHTAADAETAYEALIAEHGPVSWPAVPADAPLGSGHMVAFEPFLAWLLARRAETAGTSELAVRVALNPDVLSQWLRGVGAGAAKQHVRRATVQRALDAWGGASTIEDLYGASS